EKERQRLESLRKKQEAEEQRRKKVEEEKRRRQAEMKQKREERLRKAVQARERVEQMEEEKKKRMEQKILQNDDKVRLSQVREEKVAEERSKKKLSKKHGEADARKQKGLRVVRATLAVFFFLLQEEDEFEQQEPLQKRREVEVNEKGKKVLELKNLVERQQVEQVKESLQIYYPPVMEQEIKSSSVRCWGLMGICAEDGDVCRLGYLAESSAQCEPDEQNNFFLEEMLEAATGWQHTMRPRLRLQQPGPPAGSLAGGSPEAFGIGDAWACSPKVNENNYGMDLNSDDSTDDENDPRKPVPAWADGSQLNQAILHQYYHPVNVDQIFGLIPIPKLEDIFGKSKPRYFKRTSSAVWHSEP
ncbi:INCE protein, partial [Cepphus grylle]|nr:INCE protein [Cepphus grylle]